MHKFAVGAEKAANTFGFWGRWSAFHVCCGCIAAKRAHSSIRISYFKTCFVFSASIPEQRDCSETAVRPGFLSGLCHAT